MPSTFAATIVVALWVAVAVKRSRRDAFRVALVEFCIGAVAAVLLAFINARVAAAHPAYTEAEAPARELLDAATRTSFIGVWVPATALLFVSSVWRALKSDGLLFIAVALVCGVLLVLMAITLAMAGIGGGMIG